ncbi:flagellar hook-associated protein FlgK [Micromonosporaceae bacterium Da 78-11]
MGSTFGGINTALTSLYAQRRGLDVAGQNIANANTEGYSRQRVTMQAQNGTAPGIYSSTDGIGSGVKVSAVERGRNGYLEERGRTEHASSAYLANQTSAYGSIETVFAEPSDTALQARLHDMWDGWNDVANNWQDASTRTALIERSNTVAVTLNDAHASLSNQFDQLAKGADTYVDQVNNLAGAISDMNQKIVVATQSGLEPNDLMDQRDRQVMQLSELVGATTSSKPNGSMTVYIGNAPLVSDFTARKVELVGPTTLDGVKAGGKVALQWTDTGATAATGGTMGSMLETMNSIIPDLSNKIDGVAANLAKTINDVHNTGFTLTGTQGADFFVANDGTGVVTAKNIQIGIAGAADVAFSKGNPAAATVTDQAVDHGVADVLSDIGAAGTGPDQEYQSMIGQLGVAAQASGRRSDIQDSVTGQVDNARDGESGVNLDEEMTNLLTYQRGYEAASRVLTTIDSMLDQLINRTGMVGR